MDFDFSPEQLAFRDEVEAFLDANDDPVVFDVTRENMAQVADIPERRALMAKIGEQGWLGITWPKEWGGQEGDGVYEYLLNEALAASRRAPDRQGRRHHRQDHPPPRQREDAEGVPPEDPEQRDRLRGRLQRARRRLRRRVDEAQGHARRRRVAAERPEDVDHLGPLRRVVLGRRPDRSRSPQAPRHHAVPRAARRPRHHHQRHLDDGRRAHQRRLLRQRVRARRLRGRRAEPRVPVHLRGARPRALHHVHLLPHQAAARPAVRLRRHRGRSTTSRSAKTP